MFRIVCDACKRQIIEGSFYDMDIERKNLEQGFIMSSGDRTSEFVFHLCPECFQKLLFVPITHYDKNKNKKTQTA